MKTSGKSCREKVKPRLFPRHCEEPLRRSNPFLLLRGSMDCFAEPVIRRRFAPTGWLAMTRKERATFFASSLAKAGHPVRRGFSALSLKSLEYWIARSSRTTTNGEGCLKIESEHDAGATAEAPVNTTVTSFVYAPPTISPASPVLA